MKKAKKRTPQESSKLYYWTEQSKLKPIPKSLIYRSAFEKEENFVLEAYPKEKGVGYHIETTVSNTDVTVRIWKKLAKERYVLLHSVSLETLWTMEQLAGNVPSENEA